MFTRWRPRGLGGRAVGLGREKGALGCQVPGSRGVGQTEAVPVKHVTGGQTKQVKASGEEARL